MKCGVGGMMEDKGGELGRGVVNGLIIYVVFAVFAMISGKMILEVPLRNQLFLLVLVLVIFLLYGLLLPEQG